MTPAYKTSEGHIRLKAFRLHRRRVLDCDDLTSGNSFNKMNAPAERMEIPVDADTLSYANADLTERIKVFELHGVRLLTADEIRREMLEYPR